MAARPTRPGQQQSCRTCPTAENPKPQSQPKPQVVTLPGEADRLWKHVLFGTSTCVSMIEGYASLDMPGNPLNAIASLRDRLDAVLTNLVGKQQ